MDDASDAKWLTFAELASARGISEPSARKLVRRHKWRRQAGNQGIVRILVPEEALDRPRDDPGTDLPHDPRSDPSDEPRAIIALEAAITALREQLEQANSRADRAEQGRDRAETSLAAERARADTLRDQIEALQEQLAARQEGEDATEAIRQAEAMVDNLREAHAGEVSALKAERHRLATQIDGFAGRADQAEARTDSLRARVDVLQRERDTARAEAQEAAAELHRADAERRARGLVARLRAAWRGE